MTNNKRNLKRTGIITGTFLAVAVAGFASTSNNTTNLLDFDVLGSGSEIRADVSTLNGNLYRTLELKCGEGKCGEGKCGEETKEKAKSSKKATAKQTKAQKKAAKKAKKEKK